MRGLITSLILFFVPFGIFLETVGSSESFIGAGKTVGQQGFAFVVASCLGKNLNFSFSEILKRLSSFDRQHPGGVRHLVLDHNQPLLHLGLDTVLLCRQLFNVLEWLVHGAGQFHRQKLSLCRYVYEHA